MWGLPQAPWGAFILHPLLGFFCRGHWVPQNVQEHRHSLTRLQPCSLFSATISPEKQHQTNDGNNKSCLFSSLIFRSNGNAMVWKDSGRGMEGSEQGRSCVCS